MLVKKKNKNKGRVLNRRFKKAQHRTYTKAMKLSNLLYITFMFDLNL